MRGNLIQTVRWPQNQRQEKVPVCCYQCVAGPDLMRVEVEDGVATRIEPNYNITDNHPGGGRVCVRCLRPDPEDL